jgi:hypothetical protein
MIWGLTVAVTTRDSHPLPYSLVTPLGFEGGEHLKALTKNCEKTAVKARAKPIMRAEPQSIEPEIKKLLSRERQKCKTYRPVSLHSMSQYYERGDSAKLIVRASL